MKGLPIRRRRPSIACNWIDCTSIFVSGSIMLPLNDPGQTKKVLRMLFSSRMRFYCVRLWLYPKHFLFFIILFLDQAALLSFLYPSPRPPTFHRRNKQTNKQRKPDLRLASSSLQCPVQLPPSTRDRIGDFTWSTQCKPKQGSFSIATQSLILQKT